VAEGDKGGEFMRIEKEEGKMSSLEKRSYIRVPQYDGILPLIK